MRLKSETGQVLIIAIFGVALAAGMTALAVDVGLALHTRRDLQNAADAAALAGARELCLSPPAAKLAATDWAQRNRIDVNGGELTYVGTGQYNGSDAMEVSVQRYQKFYFAPALAFFDPGSDISTTVVAAGATATGACRGHLRPWGLAEAAVAGLVPGAEITLTETTGLGIPGNYYALAIDGTGATTYVNTIKHGSENALCAKDTIFRLLLEGDEGYEPPSADCPSNVAVQSGMTAQDTQQAMEWLIANTKPECDTFLEVFEIVIPADLPSTEVIQFRNPEVCDPNEPYNNTESRRLITVPIVQEIVLLGQTQVSVVGFAMLWLEGINCPPLGLVKCEVATVLVDVMARVPWYRSTRLVE